MSDEIEKGAVNEGEGNRTADERYRRGVEETVRKGHVEQDAERAARDVDENPEEYRRAEEEGRKKNAGDLPADLD